AVVCIVTQQAFAESASLVGSWHADDGRTYYEVHFRPNHTFTLFARMSTRNPELAVAQMGEQSGTWQIAGDRIVLDSAEISPKRLGISLEASSPLNPERTRSCPIVTFAGGSSVLAVAVSLLATAPKCRILYDASSDGHARI